MYETIMLDGEEIRVKLDVDEKQTGKIILPELNNTEDLSEDEIIEQYSGIILDELDLWN